LSNGNGKANVNEDDGNMNMLQHVETCIEAFHYVEIAPRAAAEQFLDGCGLLKTVLPHFALVIKVTRMLPISQRIQRVPRKSDGKHAQIALGALRPSFL